MTADPRLRDVTPAVTFHVRPWLARQLHVDERHVRPLPHATAPGGVRELRYLLSGRGVVVVTITKTYHEDCWRLEARWPGGEAAHEVAIETEVAA